MDIAVFIVVAVLLVAVGLMGGAQFAERRQRRDAQKALADAHELLLSEREKAAEQIRELVTGINAAHNLLVGQIADIQSKVGSLNMRVQSAAAGRQGPTHGSTQRPGT